MTKTYTAPMPPEMLPGSTTTPSLLAHLAIEKYLNGMPLNRISMSWARDGVTIDRGTMSRWLGDVGAMLNETLLAAAKQYSISVSGALSGDTYSGEALALYSSATYWAPAAVALNGHVVMLITGTDVRFGERSCRPTVDDTRTSSCSVKRGERPPPTLR